MNHESCYDETRVTRKIGGWIQLFDYLINHLLLSVYSDNFLKLSVLRSFMVLSWKKNFFYFHGKWKKIDFFLFAFKIICIACLKLFSDDLFKNYPKIYSNIFVDVVFKAFWSNVRVKSNIGTANISQ